MYESYMKALKTSRYLRRELSWNYESMVTGLKMNPVSIKILLSLS